MGIYVGPWPIQMPPGPAEGWDGGYVIDYYVMLPNPTDPSPAVAGDGSYDTYVYGTYLTPGATAADANWYTDSVGPSGTGSAPLPPVLQPGAHLYVDIVGTSDTPPTITPGSLVPLSYSPDGTNLNEWAAGHWVEDQPGFTYSPPDPYFSTGGHPNGQTSADYATHALVAEYDIAAQKLVDNLAYTGTDPSYTYHTFPFPDIDLTTFDGTLLGVMGTELNMLTRPYISPNTNESVLVYDASKTGSLSLGIHFQDCEIAMHAGEGVISAPAGAALPVPPPINTGTLVFGPDVGYPMWQSGGYYQYDATAPTLVGLSNFDINLTGSADNGGYTDTPPISFNGTAKINLLAVPDWPDISTAVLVHQIQVSADWSTGALTPDSSAVDLDLTGYTWPLVPFGPGPHGPYLDVQLLVQPELSGATFTVPDVPALATTDYTTLPETVHGVHLGVGFHSTRMNYQMAAPTWRYWHPGSIIASTPVSPPPAVTYWEGWGTAIQ